MFLIDDKKIHTLHNSQDHRDKFDLISKFIKASQKAEVGNKLWDKNQE